MMRHLRIAALLSAVLVGASAFLAQAGPPSYDGSLTLPAASTCVTQSVPVASESLTLDSIVFYDAGAVTAVVAVASSDVGYFTAIDSVSLSAAGGQSVRPRRPELSYVPALISTGGIAVSTSSLVQTNMTGRYAVRDLRFIGTKDTNAADVVIHYRVFFGN